MNGSGFRWGGSTRFIVADGEHRILGRWWHGEQRGWLREELRGRGRGSGGEAGGRRRRGARAGQGGCDVGAVVGGRGDGRWSKRPSPAWTPHVGRARTMAGEDRGDGGGGQRR